MAVRNHHAPVRIAVKWEHHHLLRCDAVLFWFPCETLCPIALYEFGVWNCRPKKLFIGTHPDYKRKLDIEIQTKLERPNLFVVSSLKELAQQVLDWSKGVKQQDGRVFGSDGNVANVLASGVFLLKGTEMTLDKLKTLHALVEELMHENFRPTITSSFAPLCEAKRHIEGCILGQYGRDAWKQITDCGEGAITDFKEAAARDANQ
jgi:hypothetical protein